MAKKGYDDWLELATEHREKLDAAISDENPKDVIYYRGKYIFAFKITKIYL